VKKTPSFLTRLATSAAARIARVRRRRDSVEAREFNDRNAPALGVAYAAFAQHSQISSGRQPRKGRDLWLLLEQARPSNIIELGSGTTSAVFALWASRAGARYSAYEHHEGWADVARQCLREAGLITQESPIVVVPSRVASSGRSTGFSKPVPPDVDFVYVDGPPCVLPSGEKVPNDDVVRLFDAGGRPRTIVVDGRLETVDLIRSHPVGRSYEFTPGYDYGVRDGLLRAVLRGGEHSVFRARPAR
jgi:predicted O-methyltransferase YrrM